jgi:hypothetical protein
MFFTHNGLTFVFLHTFDMQRIKQQLSWNAWRKGILPRSYKETGQKKLKLVRWVLATIVHISSHFSLCVGVWFSEKKRSRTRRGNSSWPLHPTNNLHRFVHIGRQFMWSFLLNVSFVYMLLYR